MADASPGVGATRVRDRLGGEVGRRLVHASGAVFPLGYLLAERVAAVPADWRAFQAVVLAGVALAAVLEALRLRVGLDWWIFEQLTREYEQEKVAGYALYALSFGVLVVAFRPAIALAAMLMLSFADPVGGILAGEDPIPVKRPLALAGTFLVCLAVGAALLPIAAAVAAAAAATVADGVFFEVREYVIDDNLTLPLSAAAAAWLAIRLVAG